MGLPRTLQAYLHKLVNWYVNYTDLWLLLILLMLMMRLLEMAAGADSGKS